MKLGQSGLSSEWARGSPPVLRAAPGTSCLDGAKVGGDAANASQQQEGAGAQPCWPV